MSPMAGLASICARSAGSSRSRATIEVRAQRLHDLDGFLHRMAGSHREPQPRQDRDAPRAGFGIVVGDQDQRGISHGIARSAAPPGGAAAIGDVATIRLGTHGADVTTEVRDARRPRRFPRAARFLHDASVTGGVVPV